MIILLILIPLIIALGTLLIAGIYCNQNIDAKDRKTYNCIIIVIQIISTLVMIMYMDTITDPQAIDVYRGKTTLEITYKDNVPVDSVVVFK